MTKTTVAMKPITPMTQETVVNMTTMPMTVNSGRESIVTNDRSNSGDGANDTSNADHVPSGRAKRSARRTRCRNLACFSKIASGRTNCVLAFDIVMCETSEDPKKKAKTPNLQQRCEATLNGKHPPKVLQQETQHRRQQSLIASQHAIANYIREPFVFGNGRADASNLLCTGIHVSLLGSSELAFGAFLEIRFPTR